MKPTKEEIYSKHLRGSPSYFNAAYEAMEEYAQQCLNERWIPVSKKPEKEGEYLVLYKMSVIYFIEIAYFKRWWHKYSDELGYIRMHRVTHWMSLPEKPQGNE